MTDPIPGFRAGRVLSRRTALLSTAAMVGGYLVGCGGGDDDDEPSSQEPAQSSPEPTPELTETASTPTATATAPSEVSVLEAEATWSQPGAIGPSARRDHSLVATADAAFVFLFGGRDGSGPLRDAWLYDVAAGSWSQLPEGPEARFGHNAVFDPEAGRMIVFGGQGGPGFFNDTWSFDGQAWQQLTLNDPPTSRYGAGAAYSGEQAGVYISHGFTDDGRFDDTWRMPLEGDAWADQSPMSGPRPVRRCLLRLVMDEQSGRLLLFGGQTDSDPFLGDLWAFDTAARSWAELAQTAGPAPRNLYSLVAVDEPAALLFGGASDDGVLNDLWALDFGSDSWSQLSPSGGPPPARSGHDTAWLPGEGSLLLFGGRDGDGNLLNDFWLLTFA